MESQLVATKLHFPKVRQSQLERPRLTERLTRGAETKLTLLSAPAGFGKTTLLAEWLAAKRSDDFAVAWLSLDPNDNEPVSFWSHVIASLQAALGKSGMTFSLVPQNVHENVESVLTTLLNELSDIEDEFALILDDYHVINHPAVQAGMEFLLVHLPPNVHVVISTRADPALPLPRLRARGELIEIRAADLRFTVHETSTYLNDVKGLGFKTKDITSLDGRAEGWIAALQLVALSLQSRHDRDVSAFVAGFAGTDKYIFDYLVDEVLDRQSDKVRRFLLQTCFLNRLSGPLCDEVTGETGSAELLETLDRQNLFVVPLDDRRQWYRYHHLFADVLLTHCSEDLHQELTGRQFRASHWHERHGARSEAIQYALAGKDFELAAELIERAIPSMRQSRQDSAIRGWLQALPDELLRVRPVLSVGLVGILVSNGSFDEVENRLNDAERCLAALATGVVVSPNFEGRTVVFVDAEQLRRLPAAIELYRAALSQIRGDVAGMTNHAQLSFDLAPKDDHLGRAGASGFLGIAFWTVGNLEAARRNWTNCVEGLQHAEHVVDSLGAAIALADVTLSQGSLVEAMRVYERAVRFGAEKGIPAVQGSADVLIGLSDIHRERNELQEASQYVMASLELGEQAGLPSHPFRSKVALARQRYAEGDLKNALDLLDEAESLRRSDFFPNVRPVAAIRARIQIAQQHLSLATRWQRESGLDVDDELGFLREYEHITLARLLLLQLASESSDWQKESVRGFLDRLLEAANRGSRLRSVIEISILQSLFHHKNGEFASAFVSLKRALTLAEPEGYVRVFVDEGEPMAALLKAAIKHKILPGHTRRLIGAFDKADRPVTSAYPEFVEPLTERELEVLRLLGSDLDGPNIAQQLSISLNTMRTHTKNIYEKLGANSRRSAVRLAKEFNMLGRISR